MSNEPTTEQMDDAIARFVGGMKVPHPSLGHPHMGYYCHKGEWWNEEKLQYHSSWDWLMPVVEKIETVEMNGGRVLRTAADVKIFYKACTIEYSPDEESGDPCEDEITIQTQGETKLQAVYKAAYQFIQWYNKQKEVTNDRPA